MLVLQVVEQAQALARQVVADHRHPQVAAAVAAKFLGQAETVEAGLVGQGLGLFEQVLPLGARQAAVVEIGAGPFTAVVEEALVVVLGLQRLDLGVDEGIEPGQVVDQFSG